MTNSADPDQLASTLFAKIGHVVFSKRRVKSNSSEFLYIFLLAYLELCSGSAYAVVCCPSSVHNASFVVSC